MDLGAIPGLAVPSDAGTTPSVRLEGMGSICLHLSALVGVAPPPVIPSHSCEIDRYGKEAHHCYCVPGSKAVVVSPLLLLGGSRCSTSQAEQGVARVISCHGQRSMARPYLSGGDAGSGTARYAPTIKSGSRRHNHESIHSCHMTVHPSAKTGETLIFTRREPAPRLINMAIVLYGAVRRQRVTWQKHTHVSTRLAPATCVSSLHRLFGVPSSRQWQCLPGYRSRAHPYRLRQSTQCVPTPA